MTYTIFMNEADWDDIVGEGMGKIPTPDKVWQEIIRRAPKTAA